MKIYIPEVICNLIDEFAAFRTPLDIQDQLKDYFWDKVVWLPCPAPDDIFEVLANAPADLELLPFEAARFAMSKGVTSLDRAVFRELHSIYGDWRERSAAEIRTEMVRFFSKSHYRDIHHPYDLLHSPGLFISHLNLKPIEEKTFMKYARQISGDEELTLDDAVQIEINFIVECSAIFGPPPTSRRALEYIDDIRACDARYGGGPWHEEIHDY